MEAPTGTPLPAAFRWALVASVVIGFQVSLAAAFDLQAVLNLDEPVPMSGAEAVMPGLGLSPLDQREAWLASVSGQRSALLAMKPWRLLTSGLLSVVAGLVFFMGVRLRVSQEGRVEIAQQLARAAVGVAVLRAIDGAQNLVVARAAANEMAKTFLKAGLPAPEVSVMPWAVSAASVGWTILMVGVFVALSSYFRSEGLRGALERAEP